MIDLLCLNAPFRPYFSRPSRSPCVTRGGTLYYPMSLLTMTSYAIQKGFDARIMDCIANPNPYWKTEIKKLNPRIIIVDTSTPSIYNDIKIADNLQESLPNSQVILVGRHVTYAPTETLRFCKKVKIICRKEFFTSIVELLEGKEYKKVKSVSYKEDGKIYHNPDSKLVTNVDDFGFISKIINRQLNPKRYYYSSTRNPYIMLQTAWGCPYNCSFCNEVVKHKWRHRSIDHIIEELKYLDKNMSFVKEIYWDDPTFVVDETFTQELCDAIITNKIKIKWSCVTRANISLETLKIMKKANGRTMHIGLESTNQEALDNINKGMNFLDEVEYLKN
ncbi:MAG: radical SAM protein, partial [Candidatus Aenigmatarchaeota archaeon]